MTLSLQRIYEIIEKAEKDDQTSRIFDVFIIGLILLNILAVMLESFVGLRQQYSHFFRGIEIFSVIVFTIEYGLRFLTIRYKYPQMSLIKGSIWHFFSFMALVDLLAILPFYLPMLWACDLRFLRILRLTRLLRILKVNRYTESLEMIGRVLAKKKEELIVTMFVTFLLLLLSSSMMYYIESEVQPEAFSNIIASFWWGVATLTTVGYGDIYPVTIIGKILSGIIALLGIGLVALPTGIISSGFMEEMNERKQIKEDTQHSERKYCPFCGKRLDS